MKREHQGIFFSRAEALMLMDEGPSEALEACLVRAMGSAIPVTARDYAEEFDRWVRSNATSRATSGVMQSPTER
ncbi:hypothetical protein [Agromyces sp. M3QZ16-3]|uniref:hypothetical protein n=1 Tax=Agromyces sp. M3QZ16-3 TaxID=3447585 RepID=UPI003F68BECF